MLEQTTSSTLEEAPERLPVTGVSFGQSTHPGRLRMRNEDHHGAAPDLGFFVVADGVGGAPAGATASRMATAAMVRSLRSGSPDEGDDEPTPPPLAAARLDAPRLIAAAYTAHQMIRSFALKNGCLGSATTMAALWITGGHFHAANTGDSRIYRLGEAGLEQLSKDHTAIEEYRDLLGPPSEEWAHRLENVVTHVLGGKRARLPAVHLVTRPLARREVFLLCTDGLTKMVSEADIAFVLGLASSPQHATDVLVEMANEAGGVDNTTCLVVHAEP